VVCFENAAPIDVEVADSGVELRDADFHLGWDSTGGTEGTKTGKRERLAVATGALPPGRQCRHEPQTRSGTRVMGATEGAEKRWQRSALGL
jgi:hypothetical protein